MEVEIGKPGKQEYDVAIFGGGWAGQCLARQLHIQNPDIKIVVLESATVFKPKVGEATIEVTGHYMVKRVNLSTYMYLKHLPKNGLRMFFDNEQKDADLETMSEFGTSAIPSHPAFQIDRKRFEEDLYKMNRDNGIEVHMGVSIKDFTIESGETPHTVEWANRNGESGSIKARWLVDASGRKRLIGTKLGLHFEENTLNHCASWGRFEGVNDIDQLGDEAFRDRVKDTSRYLSTNHVVGRGYWIWFIPLSSGHVSIGLVCNKDVVENPPLKKADFLEFIKRHKAARQIIGDGELVDHQALPRLAYRTKQLYSSDRWATTGFASMFLDPYLSAGGDFISWGNDYITEIIRQDMAPEVDAAEFNNTIEVYNDRMQENYERLHIFMNSAYSVMGSYNLFKPRLVFDTCLYFIRQTWGFMNKEHMLIKEPTTLKLMRHLFELEDMLKEYIDSVVAKCLENGTFYNNNTTQAYESGGSFFAPFVFSMGNPGQLSWRLDLCVKLWIYTYIEIIGVAMQLPRIADRVVVQNILNFYALMDMHPFDDEKKAWLFKQIEEYLAEAIQKEFMVSVQLEVTNESFEDKGMIKVTGWGQEVAEDQQKKINQKIQYLWNDDRPYIGLPPQAQVFSRFFAQRNKMMEKEMAAKDGMKAGMKDGMQGEPAMAGNMSSDMASKESMQKEKEMMKQEM